MPVEFTKNERLLLSNQFRILQRLVPEEAAGYEQAVKILERGYTFEYGGLLEPFSDELGFDECREVMDILDMHRMLNDAYRKLEDQTGIDPNALKFRGFDGNQETEQMGYARFLIRDQGKWDELLHTELNSHYPTLPSYRSMLQQWRASKDQYALTKDDLIRISAKGRG